MRWLAGAIEIKPDLAQAYNNRAASYYYLKQYDRAWANVALCRKVGGSPNAELVRLLTEAAGPPRRP